MKIFPKNPPRKFKTGLNGNIEICDTGEINLDDDELITFTKDGRRYDVVAKNWGYYATPSVNGRLAKEGYKTALVKNRFSRYYVLVVAEDKLKEFKEYLAADGQEVVSWLDEIK